MPEAWEGVRGGGKCQGHLHLLGVGGFLALVLGHLAPLRLVLALGRLRPGPHPWGEPPAVRRSCAVPQHPALRVKSWVLPALLTPPPAPGQRFYSFGNP